MDVIFFGLCFLFFIFGFLRGGIKTALSFLSGVLSFAIALFFCAGLAEVLWGVDNFGVSLSGWVKKIIDEKFGGVFSDKETLFKSLNNSTFGVLFGEFFENVLKNIEFDGQLTVGQVFAGTISNMILRVLAFVLIYVASFVVLKIVGVLIAKMFRKNNFLKISDRIIGGLFGVFKGFLVFFVCYFVIVQFANFTLNENVVTILEQAPITSLIYEGVVVKFFNFIL